MGVSTDSLPQLDMSPVPPVANRIPAGIEIHGERLSDDYAWLRDKPNPDVSAYLVAENSYADAVMAPTKPLQDTLYREMLARINETDTSPPYRDGDYFWYARTEEGRQYPILCRKHRTLDAPEEIALDVNALAEDEAFMALGTYAPSDDGRLLAYSTDNTGFRHTRCT